MKDLFEKLIRLEAPCTFHEVTGLYCPGCGCTRAAKFLIRGDVKQSLIFNPIVLYICIATFIFLLFAVKYKVSGKVLKKDRIILPMLYIGVFILLVNWIIKDFLLIFKGISLL